MWHIYHPGQSLYDIYHPGQSLYDRSTTQGSPCMTDLPPRAVPVWQIYHPGQSLYDRSTTQGSPCMTDLPPRAVPFWQIYHPGQSLYGSCITQGSPLLTDLPPRAVPVWQIYHPGQSPFDRSTNQGSPCMTAVSPMAVPIWQPYFHASFIKTWFGGSPTMTLINLPHAILVDPCTMFRGILPTTKLPPCYFDWSLHSVLGYPTCGKSASVLFWLILAQRFGVSHLWQICLCAILIDPGTVFWGIPHTTYSKSTSMLSYLIVAQCLGGGGGGCSQMV